jgi:hypothetical protein
MVKRIGLDGTGTRRGGNIIPEKGQHVYGNYHVHRLYRAVDRKSCAAFFWFGRE